MLTDDERVLVKKTLENYPAGVPTGAWGSGPMAQQPAKFSFYEPGFFLNKTIESYG